MSEYVEKILTAEGEKQIDYNALANKPIQRIESLDKTNKKDLRSIESGVYILYGYFSPFPGSPSTLTIDNVLAIVAQRTSGSQLLLIYALNSKQTFIEVLVDSSNSYGFTYQKIELTLTDLMYMGDLAALKTTEKTSLVGAINEIYDMVAPTA